MTDRACWFLGFLVVAVAATYVVFMASTQSFTVRCAKVYEPNSPKHELCVARVSEGGPLHEENIGKMP